MRRTAHIAISLLLAGGTVMAQNVEESKDTIATAIVSSTFGSIIVPQRISGKELGSAADLSDAVRKFTGVQIRDYGGVGGLKTVNVRSLGSEHVGVFIDGIQVGNAQNMQVDLGRFGTGNLAGISLFNGQKASALQSAKEYSSANVLYLDSARPAFSNGRKTNLRMRLKTGSFGTLAHSGTFERSFKKGVSGRVSAEGIRSNGRYRFHTRDFKRDTDGSLVGYDTVMTRQNCGLRSLRAEAQFFGPASDAGTWNVHGYCYGSERGLPGPVYKRANEYPLSEDLQKDRNFFVQGRYSCKLTERWSLMGKAKYSSDFLEYSDVPELRTDLDPALFRYRNRSGYGSVAALCTAGRHWKINFAQDVQHDRLSSNMNSFPYPKRLTSYSAVSGMYASGSIEAALSVLYMWVHDTFENPGGRGSAGRDALMPFGVIKWTASDRLSFNAFAKRSVRMPTFNDLYYATVVSMNLKPEDALQSGLGADWTWASTSKATFSAKAEIHCSALKDKIIAVPTSNQFRWSMYNLGRVRVFGANAVLGYRRTVRNGSFGGDLRYTCQHTEDRTDKDALTWRGMVPYIPLHSGSVNLFGESNGWRAGFTAFAMSERFSTSANLPAYRLAPWGTIDAAVSKTFSLSGSILVVRAVLNNLLNEQYEVVDKYPMPGFNAFITAEYSF